MEHLELERKVRGIVNAYLEAWKATFSDLEDLDSLEREELLGVVQDELGMAMDPIDVDELLMKDDFSLDDIVGALEDGVALY